MAAKPIVDGLERDYRIQVIRLNANEHAGKEAGEQFDFQFTPSFILFDGEGHELWRGVGSIDRELIGGLLETE